MDAPAAGVLATSSGSGPAALDRPLEGGEEIADQRLTHGGPAGVIRIHRI
jgi:hypothetical protein